MSGDEVERLLRGYLDEDQRSVPQPKHTGPGLPAVARLTDELEGLLARYLETTVQDGEAPAFALPRKREVDAMLRRFHADKDVVTAGVLERTLRDHVDVVEASRKAGGSTLAPENISDEHPVLSPGELHGIADLAERFDAYAQLVMAAEEAEEEFYAFQPDTETIRGVAPAGKLVPPAKKG